MSIPEVNTNLISLPFLQTETKPESESEADFTLRRIFEECNFFAKLSAPENAGTKIELTNRARIATRTLTQWSSYWLGSWSPVEHLPNNVYCFSGAFGYQFTTGITRAFTGAQENDEFVKGLDSHLDVLCDSARTLARDNEQAKEGLTIALYRCAKGIQDYMESFKQDDFYGEEKEKSYDFFRKTLSQRVSAINHLKQEFEFGFPAIPQPAVNEYIEITQEITQPPESLQEMAAIPVEMPIATIANPIAFNEVDKVPVIKISHEQTEKIQVAVENFLNPYIAGYKAQELFKALIKEFNISEERSVNEIGQFYQADRHNQNRLGKFDRIYAIIEGQDRNWKKVLERELNVTPKQRTSLTNLLNQFERQCFMKVLQTELEFSQEEANQVEEIAFQHYIYHSARGLYLKFKLSPSANLHTTGSNGFNQLVDALLKAIPIDFPGKRADRFSLRQLATKALTQVNQERMKAQEDVKSSLKKNEVDRRNQVIQMIEKKIIDGFHPSEEEKALLGRIKNLTSDHLFLDSADIRKLPLDPTYSNPTAKQIG